MPDESSRHASEKPDRASSPSPSAGSGRGSGETSALGESPAIRADPIDAIPESFGAALQRLRKEHNLSLAQLSARVDYTRGYLSKIETGKKRATIDVARRCDDALVAGGALLRLVPEQRRDVDTTPVACEPRGESATGRECPYRGLSVFRTQDHPWFFGRDRAVETLVGRLARQCSDGGALMLVAASGTGKSSLIRAGLVPALERGELSIVGSREWPVAICTPTADPMRELTFAIEIAAGRRCLADDARAASSTEEVSRALIRLARSTWGHSPAEPPAPAVPVAARLVLLIDQFEETFSLCRDEAARRAFVRTLSVLADPRPDGEPAPALVVLALRADYSDRCLQYPELVRAFSRNTLGLGPMTHDELREAITGPARAARVELEAGVVECLLTDLGSREERIAGPEGHGDGSIGGLPLLSHALAATWRHREANTMTVAAYRLTGGVHGAVATTAEHVFARLAPEARRTARQLLLRLIHVDDVCGAGRRRVGRDVLLAHTTRPDTGSEVLSALTGARLLTADRETVEITHEALIHAWPRLRDWIRDDRAGLVLRQKLGEAAATWDSGGRQSADLYRGARLALARAWARDADHHHELGPLEIRFLMLSNALERHERSAVARSARLRRRVVGALAGLLVLTLTASVLGLRQRAVAIEERRLADSRADAARASSAADGRPETMLRSADHAFRTARTVEARGALLSTQAQPFAGRITGHEAGVNAVAFSPDDRLVATAGDDETIRLWETGTRRSIATLAAHSRVRSIAFSPDGATIAAARADGAIGLWDTATHRLVADLGGRTGVLNGMAFSPDGRTIASAGADATVVLWDVPSRRRIAELVGHQGAVATARFSPDGHVIATTGNDGTLRLWDTDTRTPQATFTGHTGEVAAAAFSPDGRTIATAGTDRTVRLWDVTTGRSTATLTGHGDEVTDVAFSPDGGTLAAAGGDGTVILWETSDRHLITSLRGHTDYVLALAFGHRGDTLVTGSFDHSAVLWDLGRQRLTVRPFSRIRTLAVDAAGHVLASGGTDGRVHLWDVDTRAELPAPPTYPGPVYALAFSPDGRLVAGGGDDRIVRLWDAVEHRPAGDLATDGGPTYALAFSLDGRVLAGASADWTVSLWDTATHRRIGTLTGHRDWVNNVVFSPDGRTLATASDDGSVKLWDVAQRTMLAELTDHMGSVHGLAYSPDGRHLVTGSADRSVRFWDTRTRRLETVLAGHTGSVLSLAFAADGRTLASAGSISGVDLWDTRRRRPIATLTGHDGAVWAVAFVPRAPTLLSAGNDGTVRLWDTDVDTNSDRIRKTLASFARHTP